MITSKKVNTRTDRALFERRKIIMDSLTNIMASLTQIARLPIARTASTYLATAIESLDAAVLQLANENANEPAPDELKMDA